MSEMQTADEFENAGIQELSFDELDGVAGGPAPLVWLAWVGGAAAAGVVGTAAVGFVDGMIKGFQDNE